MQWQTYSSEKNLPWKENFLHAIEGKLPHQHMKKQFKRSCDVVSIGLILDTGKLRGPSEWEGCAK